MCSGKTRVGRELAALMQRRHIDLDRVIEKETGPLVPFFKEKGEEAFRKMETQILQQLLTEKDVIISTGGGTPCIGDNLQKMKDAGTVIWLDVPMPALMPRIIRAGGDRPLLFGYKGEALQERVNELLAEREPYYADAQLIVQAGDAPETVAARIKTVLDLQAR